MTLITQIIILLQVVVDEILQIVTELKHIQGFKRVQGMYHQMISYGSNHELWAFYFEKNISSFDEVLVDFQTENVREFLTKIYKTKCAESLDPLHKAFRLASFFSFYVH